MEIETKFKIGDEVIAIYINQEDNGLEIKKEKIKYIMIGKKGIPSYNFESGNAIIEKFTLSIEEKDKIIDKIKELGLDNYPIFEWEVE